RAGQRRLVAHYGMRVGEADVQRHRGAYAGLRAAALRGAGLRRVGGVVLRRDGDVAAGERQHRVVPEARGRAGDGDVDCERAGKAGLRGIAHAGDRFGAERADRLQRLELGALRVHVGRVDLGAGSGDRHVDRHGDADATVAAVELEAVRLPGAAGGQVFPIGLVAGLGLAQHVVQRYLVAVDIDEVSLVVGQTELGATFALVVDNFVARMQAVLRAEIDGFIAGVDDARGGRVEGDLQDGAAIGLGRSDVRRRGVQH